MKIVVTEDKASIAGSEWKKGTLLEAPTKAAKEAVADKLATDDPEAIEKAQAAARKDADAAKEKKAAAKDAKSDAKTQSTEK